MKIALLTIGNELLEGRIVDLNASFLCQSLYSKGYLVAEKRSILDTKAAILQAFKELFAHFDLLITSGGLGPTLDDLTLSCACDFFESQTYFDQSLFEKLQKKYPSSKPQYLEYAAYVPQKATYFKNHIGVAPGYLFQKDSKRMILLPGVPHEFQFLVKQELLPLLLKESPLTFREYKEIIHLCQVPESEIAPLLEAFKKSHEKLDFGIYPHLGILSIHVKVKAKSAQEAKVISHPMIKEIQKLYPKHCFFEKNSLQEALQHEFVKKGWTLSVAESCSGGAIASSLTQVSGSSSYFKSSLVAYSNSIKHKLLKVSTSTLENEGAVSEACVKQMALGCNQLFETDFAIATSGIAGPTGGSEVKPVGTVWIAIAKKNTIIFCKKMTFKGQRSVIIERTVLYSLAQLWMIRDNA